MNRSDISRRGRLVPRMVGFANFTIRSTHKFRPFRVARLTRALSCSDSSIDNPYKSPNSECVASVTSALETQPATYAGAAFLGVRVAIKWVTRIFAPVAILGFLFFVSAIMYRGIWHDDWSPVSDTKGRWETIEMFTIIPMIYIVPCFWGCLFASAIYCLRHAVSLRASKTKADAG